METKHRPEKTLGPYLRGIEIAVWLNPKGRSFTIMEVNGAGSEAIQAWDPDIGLFKGLGMVFEKQRILFAIGNAMRGRGVKPMSLMALARLNSRQIRLIDHYPPSN